MRSAIFRRFFFILTFSLFVSAAMAQKEYRITVRLDGLTDSLLLLASYSGDKQFVVDTARANLQKGYVFARKERLPEGMYLIAGESKNKLFDFIVSGSQTFTITGDKAALPASLRALKSDENQRFFDYIRFLGEKQKQQALLNEQKKKAAPESDSAAVLQSRLDLLDEEVKRTISGIIQSHPESFLALFLKAMQEIEIPPTPLLPNGRPDSAFPFRYYKSHFWDNADLSDDRLIRTPFIHSKVEQYLNRLTSPAPDSLIVSMDHLLKLTGNSEEAFKYLAWYFTVKYESSEIMGYDAIFVHLADTWYQDPRMKWMNATVKENLIKRANALRPVLIGKTAPEMILIDTLNNAVSLHRLSADYIIIYFWDPDCSHCKKETPQLRDFYAANKEKYNLEVYAVCMDTSWKDMKAYIKKNELKWVNVNGYYSVTPDFRELYDVHTSPVLYLLDRNRRIIAKRILSSQMENILKYETEKK
jgi:protein-disulfide isomerase